MGLVSQLGAFLDRIFPEYMTLKEGRYRFDRLAEMIQIYAERLGKIEDRLLALDAWIETKEVQIDKDTETVLKIRDELNSLKAIMRINTGRNPAPPNNPLNGSQPWKR